MLTLDAYLTTNVLEDVRARMVGHALGSNECFEDGLFKDRRSETESR